MNKIEVRNTCFIIRDYDKGDSPLLEEAFKVYDPVTHKFNEFGMYYDKEKRLLYIPSGLDLWKIRGYFNEKYYDRVSSHPYKDIPNIRMKAMPRDEQQQEALRFMVGIGEYEDNFYQNQLSVNLDTGKGKTYCSIAAIAFFKVKSIIITGSDTLLSQWAQNIKEYTNLQDRDIIRISGSDSVNMILQGKSNKAQNGSIYLCTHGTLKSFGDTFGWDGVYKLFETLGIGIKIFDEAHTHFENMLMVNYFSNVWKTYYVTATPGRSNWKENNIYQLTVKNVPSIDLFDQSNDPHTNYVAIKWNSRPTPLQISTCKNQYGLDRMKYINYLTQNPNFYMMMRIVMDLVIKCNGRVLMYIGTNEGILRVYHWMLENYPEFATDIGIFTSLLPKEQKLKEKNKKILLSTTKSAGLGEHIDKLKMTIVLAEPFKSEIIARQTLGRTRDKDTLYVELVDLGFTYCKKFYFSKLPVFHKYALSVSDTTIDHYELIRRSENLKNQRPNLALSPISFCDTRFDFSHVIMERKKDIWDSPIRFLNDESL